MIREEKKLLKDLEGYLKKEKQFSKEEKEQFRRLKLKELRKGKGAGRPVEARKASSVGYTPIGEINKKREKEQERLLKDMKDLKEALEKKGKQRPSIINRTLKGLDK